jgi:DNA segregation ATPase FtsK/SpoIIIE, S-DNA-T family
VPRYKKKTGLAALFSKRKYQRYDDEPKGGGSWLEMLSGMSPETKKGIFIICLFVLGALSILGLLDLSGQFGQLTNYLLAISFGQIRWLLPLLLGIWIFCLLNEEKYPIRLINYIGVILFILSLCGLFHLPYDAWESLATAKDGQGGGYIGVLASLPLLRLMSFWGALVVLIAGFLVGILLALETSIYGILWPIKLFKFIAAKIKDWYFYYKLKKQEKLLSAAAVPDNGYEEEAAMPEETTEETLEPEEELAEDGQDDGLNFTKKEVKMNFSGDSEEALNPAKPKKYGPIDIPLGLLSCKVGKPTAGDIKNSQEIIRRTLQNFGIPVEMGDVNIGPTVTQYTMRPVDGVRLSKITTLNADLALALAAHPIRIEAPIPGKSLVGIEVPNLQSAKVTMGEVLDSKEYKSRGNNLQVALGKDVSGKPIFAQLDKMPHLLIAGATGSGKSVCVNAIIISLIYQNSPDELKFILVDPKRVELPLYNNIPYLLTPVITDVKKTVGALKWAITEMERRFELLAKFGNRNIASYNQTHGEKLPYIVIVIDELADLMASAASDMEAGIVRLAQMARAVGIHLILATQRPSTEVITGLIKANIPARIAFSVASSIDSRTILDGSGAEKLVGRGDMLYLGAEFSKPKRIQGVFLSDKEIGDVIRFIKSHGEADYLEALAANNHSGFGGGGSSFGNDSDEPLLNEAMDVIRESGKASASLLQRRLKLGYARAARILDILEEKEIIGPSDGAKPREVFLDKLGGVGAVQFAAREHGLSGELRRMAPVEEDDEPTFTAFSRQLEPEEVNEEIITEPEDELPKIDESEDEVNPFMSGFQEKEIGGEDELLEEVLEEELPNSQEDSQEEIVVAEIETSLEDENVEEPIAEEEILEEEPVKKSAQPAIKKRSFFDADEWS